MNMFFTTSIEGKYLVLHGQEAQHCSRVLRKKEGDHINVMDGSGNLFKAQISSIGRSEVNAAILQSEHHEKPNYPIVAFGLIKNTTRLEWLIEKITEIGVDRIIPLVSARSERKRIKPERLQKVIVSAAKQSLKYHLPILQEAVSFQHYIHGLKDSDASLFIANYNPEHKDLWMHTRKSNPCVILIGPEGDFTSEEVEMAKTAGAIGVNLGHSRLRAETAAMVACAHLNSMKES